MEKYYFARLNSDNIVIAFTPLVSSICTNSDGDYDEEMAINHLYSTIPDSENDLWIRGSKDGSIRKNPSAISYTYDSSRDAFIAPRPFNSWTLNEETCKWNPPVPYPEGPHPEGVETYIWNEEIGTWEPFYGLKSDVI